MLCGFLLALTDLPPFRYNRLWWALYTGMLVSLCEQQFVDCFGFVEWTVFWRRHLWWTATSRIGGVSRTQLQVARALRLSSGGRQKLSPLTFGDKLETLARRAEGLLTG